jgi:L-xylulokinase
MDDLFLTIDAGGTTVKAAVFDAVGRLVSVRAIDVTTHHRDNGWVERDPDAFWEKTAQAIRALTATEIDTHRIVAVACTGFGNGVFLVDENGRGTRSGIVSVDHRAQPIVDEYLRSATASVIEAISGNRIWGGQTLMQLAWLARNEPETVARTRWALACKDYIRMRLTGIAATDPTDASGGGLLNLELGTYDEVLLERAGATAFQDLLPPIVENSQIAGHVSRLASTETGLREGTPVVAAMMDIGACVVGSGVVSADLLTMVAGTWSINAVETSGGVKGRPPILNMIHRDRSCRLLADGSPTSAGNLSWYMSHVAGRGVDVQGANALVQESPVTARRCHYMPFVNGPAPRHGSFVGLVNSDDRGSMLRALYEGVAFQHRRHGEAVLDYIAAERPRTIRLAGGASKSEVWSQIFADICGLTVEVAEGEELGALGAATCAAVATGHYPDISTAIQYMCRVTRTAHPNPGFRSFYEDRYRQFLMLDQKLADLFEGSEPQEI